MLEYKSVLQNMTIDSPVILKYKSLLLNEYEWTKFEHMKVLLKPIVDWITKFEGDYCTIHLIHSAFIGLEKLLEEPTGINILGNVEHNNLKKKIPTGKVLL